jgi:phosphoribosylformylglycinamidine cyclo-ligase
MPLDAGKMVLSPTRTYAPIIKSILLELKENIHGMVHCTGGAQTKVLHFVQAPLHIIKDQLFSTPVLFKTIQRESGTSWEEMYKVFNMGHRLEIYIKPEFADQVIKISESYGVAAKVIGRVENSTHKHVTISGENGTYVY